VTVPLFRRRRQEDDEATSALTDSEGPDDAPRQARPHFVNAPAEVEEEEAVDPPFSRADGPWDLTEAPETEVTRLDLGGLLIPGYPGLELRIEVDEESGNVVSAAAVVEDAAVQIQVFAAPRTRGVWREVRTELAEGIVSAGGTAEEAEGTFGRELQTRIPVESPEGTVLQEARFVGVDGPRWFLRGVFSGKAYESGAMPILEGVLRGCVVVRGDVPMAPKDPLPLHLPDQVEGVPDPAGRPPLEPFKRGPEITEVH
jgi:Protein of unknown function (DUF3710)